MKVIADASILIHLSAIGRFYLLKELFKEITIPEGVYTEVVIEGWGFPGSLETSEALRSGFLKTIKVMDRERVREISEEYRVSLTNAEVIQLAKERNAELVLADEEEVRSAAEDARLKVTGCLGIIIEAVKTKLMAPQQASQDIDSLTASGYRIADDIVKVVKDNLMEWQK